jgi:hypothetical protein
MRPSAPWRLIYRQASHPIRCCGIQTDETFRPTEEILRIPWSAAAYIL